MTMRAGEVYEHPYERLVVRVGTAESDGRELVADVYVRANAPGVPRHIHPEMEESLTVIRGKVDTWLAGAGQKVLGPGERLEPMARPGQPSQASPMARLESPNGQAVDDR